MAVSLTTKSRQLLRSTYNELQRVVWPSRRETINHTIVVIIFSLVVALFLGGLDLLFALGLEQLLTLK